MIKYYAHGSRLFRKNMRVLEVYYSDAPKLKLNKTLDQKNKTKTIIIPCASQ